MKQKLSKTDAIILDVVSKNETRFKRKDISTYGLSPQAINMAIDKWIKLGLLNKRADDDGYWFYLTDKTRYASIVLKEDRIGEITPHSIALNPVGEAPFLVFWGDKTIKLENNSVNIS